MDNRAGASLASVRVRPPGGSDAVYEGAVQDLIDELGRLPGVGPKSAQRIAFHILNADPADARRLADAIVRVKDRIRPCRRCFNFSQDEECRICVDPRRDPAQLCVVEDARGVVAIERTHEFAGRYHVLGGAISPLDGIRPEDLHVAELLDRIGDEQVREVILALNPSHEGEATTSYLTRVLEPLGVRVTRLASGLPVGGDLDYADEVTLGRALMGRRDVDR